MSSKRILIVTNLFEPEARGGAEFLAKKTAVQFSKDGHRVAVFTTTARRVDGVERTKDGDLTVVRYRPRLPYHILEDAKQPLWKRLLWHKIDLFERRSGRLLKSVIEEEKPDLIISHNLRGMGMSVAKVMQHADVEWIHTLHDVQLLVPSGQYWLTKNIKRAARIWQSSIVSGFYQMIIRRIIGRPDRIIGPTSYIVQAHREAGLFSDSELSVLENPLIEKPERRVKDLRHDPLRLLFVGQLEPHKGVDVLIDALGRLGNRDVNLNIIGDGSELDLYMEQAVTLPSAINVDFIGRMPHDMLMKEMKKYDALVFPSVVIENCPGVLLEARAAGLPIIASEVGGVSELVDASGLFAPGEPRSLAQKIFEVLNGKVKVSANQSNSLSRYAAHMLSFVRIK